MTIPLGALRSYHVMGDCDGPGKCPFCPKARKKPKAPKAKKRK